MTSYIVYLEVSAEECHLRRTGTKECVYLTLSVKDIKVLPSLLLISIFRRRSVSATLHPTITHAIYYLTQTVQHISSRIEEMIATDGSID